MHIKIENRESIMNKLIILNFSINLKLILILCIGLVNIKNSESYAIRKKDITLSSMNNYLMEFGYLPKSDIETGNLRTEEQFRNAIKDLQKYAHIPVTGNLDDRTKDLLKRPRCGLPDKADTLDFSPDNLEKSDNRRRRKRYVVQGAKWDHLDLTWSLVNQTMEKIDGGQVRRVLRDALDIWAKNSKLTFREVYDERADIQVMFAKGHHGDGYDFDGPGSILAHAFYPGTGRGGDAHFDSDEIWHVDNRDTNDGTNLMGVAVHEFGHSLGLGHSDVQNSIMFPWYQGYDHNKDLPDDDRYGIQALYGAKYKQWASVNVPYNRPTRPITTTTTTTMKSLVFHPDRNDPRYNYNRNNEEEKRKREREERERQRERERKERERKERERKEREREERERIERERKERERIERERQRQREIEREREREREREYEREREREKEREREYEARRTYHNNRGHHHPHHISTTKRPFNYPNTQGPTTRYQHPKYHTTSMTPIKPRVVHPNYLPVKPDTCNTDYDAISMIRGELFIFKDKYLWRVRNGFPEEGYPYRIDRIFKFPQHEEFSHVDAVYENKQKKIVFFIGKKYYVFNSNTLEPNYPKPLTNLGLPDTLDKIDAALVWGHNNRTYFYSGTLYWRFDEDVEKVELDYPRDMSIWAGIGYHINAAFQYTNGKTYFFKGKTYWEFNDDRMRVAHIRPKPSAHKWMHCPREQDSPNNSKQNYEEEHYFIERNLALISAEHNNANSIKFNLITLIISLLLGILFSNTKIL